MRAWSLRSGCLVLLAVLALGVPLCSTAQAMQASPYQAGHYYPGMLNPRDLAVPPPGVFIISYNIWGNVGAYYDRDGNKLNEIPVGDPPVGVAISSQTAATALAIGWAPELDSSLKYWASFSPLYLKGSAQVSFSQGDVGSSVQGRVEGFSDIAVAPIYLGRSWDSVDVTGGYSIYIPTGRFATGGSDNVGLGYYTHQFQLASYVYFMQKATAFYGILTYELNSKVFDADISPGDRFTIEYGYSQYLAEWLELAIFGGHNMQVTEDDGDGVWWDKPYKDKKSVFGISGGLWVTDWLQVQVKKRWEYGLRQRFLVDGFQMSFMFLI